MKIKIKRANKAEAYPAHFAMAPMHVLRQLFWYIEELQQQAKWDAEKCQRES